MSHVECAHPRCLYCGELVAEGDEGDEMLVSALRYGEVTFDCVLVVHKRCDGAFADEGDDLFHVKALGQALLLAAEFAAKHRARKRESQSQAPAARSH